MATSPAPAPATWEGVIAGALARAAEQPTTNAARREYLDGILSDRAHNLHQDLYALKAAADDDPLVSTALQYSLRAVTSAVSSLTDALYAATELLTEQQRATHEPTD